MNGEFVVYRNPLEKLIFDMLLDGSLKYLLLKTAVIVYIIGFLICIFYLPKKLPTYWSETSTFEKISILFMWPIAIIINDRGKI